MTKKTLFIILGSIVGLFLLGAFVLFVGYRMFTASPSYEGGYGYSMGSMPDYESPLSSDSMFLDSKGSYESQELSSDEMVNDAEGSKIQKNGSVSVLVEDIDSAVDGLKAVNTKYSGLITNIYDYGQGNDRVVTMTVKVPVADFESYYNDLRELDGEVTYANVSTTDVTEEYIDITSRLTNLRSTEAQLVKIMEKADTVEDILAVQSQLNTVRGDIESYEQRKRYFDSQTDYSYMSVTFALDKTGLNVAEDEWKPWGEVKAALKSLVSVLKGLVNVIIWLVVFSPLVLVPFFVIRYFVRRKRAKNTVKMV